MRAESVLPWIVAFKAAKTVLLVGLGAALIAAIHRDPIVLVWRAADAVRLPADSQLLDRALEFALRATPRKEVGAALAAFGYAALIGTEGVGLYLRRQWARWFTIGVTGSFIPVELYELVRRPTPMRVALLVLNIAVVVYLYVREDVFEQEKEKGTA
jgi:uncharacterized membrane protein (DUF2068 family)